MKYRHDYSQHFLQDPHLVHELIGHTNIKKRDTVLDIGAGSGSITSVLARKVQSVIAVESDPIVLKKLRSNTAQFDNITIIESDIADVTLPTTPYKVFSNIPFHLSAAILRQLAGSATPPTAMYIIAQKQFARKLILDKGDHFKGMLGAQLTAQYAARIRRPLRRTDFRPPPNVDTVLLELRLREEPLIAPVHFHRYRDFVERCYRDLPYFARYSKLERPSQLLTDDWIALFQHYQR